MDDTGSPILGYMLKPTPKGSLVVIHYVNRSTMPQEVLDVRTGLIPSFKWY
jgi:hypothetical protein